ncbi:MAG TPA: AAC(3) family N-acetyltransferase, partial [Lentisphaeria bacterium]|nr:AAC(3) family N-acetyltransferase [Lentisphaeria bacterium]
DKVVGAVNHDAVLTVKGRSAMIQMPGPAKPFYGSSLAEIMVRQINGLDVAPTLAFDRTDCRYHDDMFMSDPTVGVPTLWPRSQPDGFWHNSVQTTARVDLEAYRRGIALGTAMTAVLATPRQEWLAEVVEQSRRNLAEDRERASDFAAPAEFFAYCSSREAGRLRDFGRFLPAAIVAEAASAVERESAALASGLDAGAPTSSPWRDCAAGMILERATIGFPQDIVAAPKRLRRRLNARLLYSPLGHVLAAMDGETDLGRLIRLVEYDQGAALEESEVKNIVTTVCQQADYGYLKLLRSNGLDQAAIVSALKRVGVRAGDLLLVHSSLSGCGPVQGGAATVIQAIRDAAGSEGTVLFPTFTRPFIFLGSAVNRSYQYRPFDASDPEQLWTGEIPRALLRDHPGIRRSRHITHSWAGFGPLAAACLDVHEPAAPPASEESPMGQARQRQGRILYVGCSLASTTFLHYLEHVTEMPFLAPAVCRTAQPDGSLQTVVIQQHLPGHRDFYRRRQAEKSKFFQRAIDSGLEVRRASLGLGEVLLVDLAPLDAIGRKLIQEDPRVLLCDDPECEFCRQF